MTANDVCASYSSVLVSLDNLYSGIKSKQFTFEIYKYLGSYKGGRPKTIKMKVWNFSKGGGGFKPQIQTCLVFILVVLKYKSGDVLGRLILISEIKSTTQER